MSPGSPVGIWAGAAFSNPRTPEKAQRRLGWLQIKKKERKQVFSHFLNFPQLLNLISLDFHITGSYSDFQCSILMLHKFSHVRVTS